MDNVSGAQVVITTDALESPLPAEIQEALGELVGAAREGLLALSVGVGLRVVHELMEAEVSDRRAEGQARLRADRRHGPGDDAGWPAGTERELPVSTYRYFADRDPLQRAVMDRMLAGVSTRKFARVGEPVGEQQTASAKELGV